MRAVNQLIMSDSAIKFSEKMMQQIIKLRDAGKNIRQISEEIGLTMSTVTQCLRQRGDPYDYSPSPVQCCCTHSFLAQGCTCGYKGK